MMVLRGCVCTLAVIAGCGDDTGVTSDAFVPDAVMPIESVPLLSNCVAPTTVPTTTTLDESYGSDPLQRFDLARPSAAGAYPLVVLVHGGGWTGGSKTDYQNLITYVASQGYVAASLGYRLRSGSTNTFPMPVQDVRCALRTLAERAATYGIDTEHIVLYGYSAGAQMVSLLGVSSDVTAFDGSCAASTPVQIDGVVSVAGHMDIRDLGTYPAATVLVLEGYLGNPASADPAEAALASPITHVGAGDPPFLLMHGMLDDLVPVAESRTMQLALWAAGVPATLLTGQWGHGNPQPSAAENTKIACTIDGFFHTYTR